MESRSISERRLPSGLLGEVRNTIFAPFSSTAFLTPGHQNCHAGGQTFAILHTESRKRPRVDAVRRPWSHHSSGAGNSFRTSATRIAPSLSVSRRLPYATAIHVQSSWAASCTSHLLQSGVSKQGSKHMFALHYIHPDRECCSQIATHPARLSG